MSQGYISQDENGKWEWALVSGGAVVRLEKAAKGLIGLDLGWSLVGSRYEGPIYD